MVVLGQRGVWSAKGTTDDGRRGQSQLTTQLASSYPQPCSIKDETMMMMMKKAHDGEREGVGGQAGGRGSTRQTRHEKLRTGDVSWEMRDGRRRHEDQETMRKLKLKHGPSANQFSRRVWWTEFVIDDGHSRRFS